MNNQLCLALDCLRHDIETFCAEDGWPYNKYLELDGWYSFYVRRAVHHINGTICTTFDLSNLNVSAKKQGLGILGFFLEEFKLQAEKHNRVLYVQNVMLDTQRGIYLRRGFQRVEHEPCYNRGELYRGIDFDVCFFYDPCDLVEEVEA